MTHSATTAAVPSTPTGQHKGLDRLIAGLPDAVDRAMRDTIPSKYTPELAAQVAETAIGMLTGTICTVYPGLCTVTDGQDGMNTDENGRHFDHAGHSYTVPSRTCPEDPEIWAEFVHVSAGTAHIGFMGDSLTPEQAREKTQQLRKFADEMDALADQVEAFEQAGGRS